MLGLDYGGGGGGGGGGKNCQNIDYVICERPLTKENWFSMFAETDCFQNINLKQPIIFAFL